MAARWIAVALAAAVVVVAIATLGASVKSADRATTSAAEEPDVPRWPGAIRPGQGRLPVQVMPEEMDDSFEWIDGRDTPIGMVDVTAVRTDSAGQAHWRIAIAERPPRAAGLDAAETVISYGLVFETTGDGVGDYVVGISNEAPRPGDFRVWVTDVASGLTEEQVGPPYGFPVEFSHPDEGDDPKQPPSVVFTFLGGSTPRGVTRASPFYAWASLTSGEEGLAWDYAPDASWLVAGGKRR